MPFKSTERWLVREIVADSLGSIIVASGLISHLEGTVHLFMNFGIFFRFLTSHIYSATSRGELPTRFLSGFSSALNDDGR